MSVSRVVFGCLVAGVFGLSAAGCRVSVQTKTRYVADQPVVKTAPWSGNAININIVGVGVAENGGVTVNVDPAATSVSASARMVAWSFQKSDADLSIADATSTFSAAVDGTGTLNVVCPHGQTHGDSDSGSSGCELVTITIPAGTATAPLTLQVLSGNGDMNLTLGSAFIKNLGTNQNGTGNTIATLPATPGGTISLVSEQAGDITATMSSGWSADQVVINADPDKIVSPSTVKLGAGAGGEGTAGAGLKSLSLTSKSFAGSSGKVTLE
jgi:hypothetical protein